MMNELASSELWQFADQAPRQVVLPNRREQIRREQQLAELVTAHRFTRSQGFTRLRTPKELAALGRSLGISATPTEIEYAAARALLAIAEPKPYDGRRHVSHE